MVQEGGSRASSRSLILFGADSLSCIACLSTSFRATSRDVLIQNMVSAARDVLE